MNLKHLLFALLVCICSLTMAAKVFAGDVVNVTVGLHQAEIVNLPENMHKVVIADRSVAGVVKHAPRKVSVIGHGIGKTDIRIMNAKNRIIRQVNLTVTHDLNALKKILGDLFPEEMVGIKLVNDSVALTGSVSNTITAEKIVKTTEEFIRKEQNLVDLQDKVLNLMSISQGQQVMLRVRVGELKRDTIKKAGLGVQAIISAGSAVFGLLERDDIFKVLAEPSLTAISGETAEFLAGGEFPVPVPQHGGVMSVDYKPFGVGVKFTPFVLSENRIRVKVESEVSELSDAGAIKVSTMKIPSITTRRSHTTVELNSGESFMIAGLIRDANMTRVNEIPGLSNIPILSSLFRSAAFQRNETELVIAVTPYFVSPVESADIKLPTDNFQTPSDFELFFLGALGSYSGRDVYKQGLEGDIGFMVD